MIIMHSSQKSLNSLMIHFYSLQGPARCAYAVAEVRNPQHKQEEMIHEPNFNNFMSHKPWQHARPSRVQHFLTSSGNTSVSVFAAFLCLRCVF